jgi:hypothetical protein
MRYVWAISVTLVACYGPTVHPGAPCGPSGECPSGLTCISNVCVAPGTMVDDAALSDDAELDASNLDASPDAALYVPWGTPVELTTGVSSETDPSMTLDRLTVVFESGANDDIYIATRATATATTLTSTALTAINSTSIDKSPEISPDGLTLYFVSNRSGNYDVYRSTFSTVWSAPALMSDLSSAGDELDVAVSPDGLTAVVIDDEATNRFLIHTRANTTVAFGAGVFHPELAVSADATAPSITNGAQIIYFHAGGTRDIYVAYKKGNGTYTNPVPVTEINTVDRDAAPFVLQDDKHMIFERTSDLYETSRP